MAGGSKSKAKGNRGELALCKTLGELLGGSFLRVPNSGAFVGGKNVARKGKMDEGQARSFRGDIVPPDHLPRMMVESKFYSEFPFHLLLRDAPIPLLDGWIKQAIDTADATDAVFVAFKVNGKSWFVVVPEDEAGNYTFRNHARYSGLHGNWWIMDLMTFFTLNKSAVLRRAGPPQ